MSFINELHTNTNKYALTENGAISNTSTLNPVLDFFSKAGAMRGREKEAFNLFQKAFDADPQNAIRVLFYFFYRVYFKFERKFISCHVLYGGIIILGLFYFG